MKKVCLLTMCLSLFCFAPLAKAEKIGVYVAPKIMLSIPTAKAEAYLENAGNSGTIEIGKFGNSFSGGLAVGYDFNSRFDVPVRTELEYIIIGDMSEQNSTSIGGVELVGKGTVGIQSLFANVYYDFRNSSNFVPYVGAGLGLAFVSNKGSFSANNLSISAPRNTKTNFAYNIGLGCAYQVNDWFAIDLGYRYAGFGKSQSKNNDILEGTGVVVRSQSKNIGMHQIMLSTRFTF